MIGRLVAFTIEPATVEEALVRASANLLILCAQGDRREAKLVAASMDEWEPEFTNRVQRRIDAVEIRL